MTALARTSNAPLEQIVETANRYAADAKAKSTQRAYKTDWKAFQAWCTSKGLPSAPAAPAAVAVYLSALAAAGRKVSTIERALAGIAHAQRAAGHEWRKGDPQITEVVKGIKRTHGAPPVEKAPISDTDLANLVKALSKSPHRRAVRDCAILIVGWFGAFRRSELVALEVRDIVFSESGLVITLRRSKTDQEGKGKTKGLPFAGNPALCPVRTLRAWLDLSGITSGRIFHVSDRTVARLIQRAARDVGLDPKLFAGHSLRSGFVTTASRKGKSLDSIMRQTGHTSVEMVRRYIRRADLFEDNAAAGLV